MRDFNTNSGVPIRTCLRDAIALAAEGGAARAALERCLAHWKGNMAATSKNSADCESPFVVDAGRIWGQVLEQTSKQKLQLLNKM